MSAFDVCMKDPEFLRIYAEEEFVTRFTEALAIWMKTFEISKSALAKRLNVKRSDVTRYLRGNLTIREVASILYVTDGQLKFSFETIPYKGFHSNETN